MSEGCTGQNGTFARVKRSGFGLGVPNGWMYAQTDDATIMTSNDAELVVATFDLVSTEASREGAFAALVNLLGVSPPKHRVSWATPAKKARVGGLEVWFWQADDVTKGLKKGPVLIFGTELPTRSWLLGAGFVPSDDRSDADKAILGAIESIGPVPPAPPAASP